jgi:dipeptidyl aminopeptidase/acylaminoacyl peptidase
MNGNRNQVLQGIEDNGVPVMVVHGDADEVVSVEESRTWTAAM